MSGFDRFLQRPTFVSSENTLARFVARPVLRFIDREIASGVLLLIATATALIWVNSPWGHTYGEFWHTDLELLVGSWDLHLSLEHFVNDGLMALFFFVVGLEIKRELTTGYLSTMKDAALPAIAALGGMVVPALLFFALNPSGPASKGWGIPMATDIAFAVGIVALLGSRVSPRLKLFLLTLAIVDDIGAIAVIAIFYSEGFSLGWFLAAVGGLALVRGLQGARVWAVMVYVLIGLFVWYATLRSGVHATIAGVALGLLTPARPLLPERDAQAVVDCLPDDASVGEVRHAAFLVHESVPVTERIENWLHPFTAYLIIPIFALANAGIKISGDVLGDAISSNVVWGIILGLVVGKPVGITLFTWVATKFGFELPAGINWGQYIGMAVAAGIGFTVAIFVSGLAFDVEALTAEAKIGILAASCIAGIGCIIILAVNAVVDDDPDTHG
ncbi:MAG: NhaA family Na+:H+ antiporter [Candidatus Poriferisodalaceae bacterium]|jgi:NhaA family Na+:H+ antiporter